MKTMTLNRLGLFLVILLCVGATSCGKIASKIGSKTASEAVESTAKKGAKEIAEKTSKRGVKKSLKEESENALEKSTELGVKRVIRETEEDVIEQSLREMAKTDKLMKEFYDQMISKVSKEFADGITVKTTKEGMEFLSKDFPTSFIKINKNFVTGKAGSLKNAGPVNEFLNFLMPNKTYMIDESFVYKTDKLGRVVEASADRTKAYKTIQRNTQRNSDVQKSVILNLEGRQGSDDAGHLFANNTGGPNELINQVPMNSSINRSGGAWRKLEQMEEQALKEGKQVVSQRKLLYKGDSKRPYAIEFITKIDGVEVVREVVENVL